MSSHSAADALPSLSQERKCWFCEAPGAHTRAHFGDYVSVCTEHSKDFFEGEVL